MIPVEFTRKEATMSPQAGYLLQEEVVPRLRSAVPHAVRCVGCEDAQELIQDGTAMAARMLDSAERAGKRFTPGNIAYYTIQHLKSGRRSTGSTVVDVLGTGTQLSGHTRLTSFEEPAAISEETGGEIFLFHDVLSTDQEDPSMAVARKMDWDSFCAGLSKREITLIHFLSQGQSLRDMAVASRVSDSTIQTTKRKLASAILDFMGPDFIRQVQRQPGWHDGVNATREKMACRGERQAD